jgi:GAF domain-containing protein
MHDFAPLDSDFETRVRASFARLTLMQTILIQVSDKREGEFTEEDEASLMQLAQYAATAVDHVRKRARAARRSGRHTGGRANCGAG